MKYAICSDLHLEFYKPKMHDFLSDKLNQSDADFVIVAGDLSPNSDVRHRFLQRLTKPYLFVKGNHELYDGISRLAITDSVYKWPKYNIAGCTLWVDFNHGNPLDEVWFMRNMNDYRPNQGATPDAIKKLNARHREFIFSCGMPIIVTHHAPSYKSVTPFYRESVNSSFVNDLDEQIANSNIKLFVHGHVHSNHDYMIGNTRVVCHPLGYPGELYSNYKDYEPLIIEI